jgi:hypothetical protein
MIRQAGNTLLAIAVIASVVAVGFMALGFVSRAVQALFCIGYGC